jgi:hypothetical protein
LQLGRALARWARYELIALDEVGYSSKLRVSRGALYTLLRNPIYIGEVRHKRSR